MEDWWHEPEKVLTSPSTSSHSNSMVYPEKISAPRKHVASSLPTTTTRGSINNENPLYSWWDKPSTVVNPRVPVAPSLVLSPPKGRSIDSKFEEVNARMKEQLRDQPRRRTLASDTRISKMSENQLISALER